ncbi:MAG: hypothetical protein JXL97_04290 [Bacteroidales bacterium]|nr:hypothetical protein [Bacteroidales bacterium]
MKANKNIKFLRNVILIFLSVYITIFIFIEAFPLSFNNVNNTRWKITKQVFEKKYDLSDSTINILFIGDSRLNAALDFTKIDYSWSFGMGGSTTIESYYLIKKYISVYKKPDTIVMSISPRFLTEIFAFWDLAIRNDFFTKAEFKEIAHIHKQLDDTILKGKLNTKYWLYKMNFPAFFQEDVHNNLIIFGKEKNEELISYVLYNRGKRPHPNLKESCSSLNNETKMTKFEPSPIFNFYFDKILQLCKDEQINLIFMAMPMNESSFSRLSTDFVDDYKKYMDKKQKAYPKFIISNDLYALPDSLFGDESHLNAKGTEFFTEEFLKGKIIDVQ